MKLILLILILFLKVIYSIDNFYFFLEPNETLCFNEYYSDNTLGNVLLSL